ncbi:hypothetical protein niasHT_011878 [Heterodera trifolii]|uniref:Uncharacterized protein n=1 Tax=Heterodera trifolii TaxID=157864 RepID=A0ABD2KU78_9BILA
MAEQFNAIAERLNEIERKINSNNNDNSSAEEKERKRSLVLIGLPEAVAEKPSERAKEDAETVAEVLDALDVEVCPQMVYRMGRRIDEKRKATLLVQKGADVNLADTDGITPLIAASFSGQVDIARFLLSHGAIVEQTDFSGTRFALLGAATEARLEVCRLLVDEWAADVNQETIEGTTALIRASEEGHVDVVNFLIERGANLHHTDMDGYNSLMCAVRNVKTEMARHLVAIGARTDQIGTDGKTARDLAEEGEFAEMIDIFRAAAEQRENVDGQQNEHQQQQRM